MDKFTAVVEIDVNDPNDEEERDEVSRLAERFAAWITEFTTYDAKVTNKMVTGSLDDDNITAKDH